MIFHFQWLQNTLDQLSAKLEPTRTSTSENSSVGIVATSDGFFVKEFSIINKKLD